MLLHVKTRLVMDESKNLDSHPLNDENDNDLSLGDGDLTDSNFQDFPDLPNASDEPPTSSKYGDQQISSNSLLVTNGTNIIHKASSSDNDSEQSYISSKNTTDRYENLNNGNDNSDSNQSVSDSNSKNPTSTKNLALRYNLLSENKQNELVILQKLEYFLLKFKWNAKVQEITNNLVYPMKTILECDNSCASKLNLTNLVVRLKQKTEKVLLANTNESNEFVNEYLVKLIHLILSKHKCSPMCNELSLILIRNYFKQLELPEFSSDALESIHNDALMDLLKKKLDLHLNEAHSCSSLVTLNRLPNIQVNNETMAPETPSSTTNTLMKEAYRDLVEESERNRNSRDETRNDDFQGYGKNSNYGEQDENGHENDGTIANENENDDDDLDEEELFFIKKERFDNNSHENSQNMTGMTSKDITDEYQFSDQVQDFGSAAASADKTDKDMYYNSNNTSQQDQSYYESPHNPKSTSSNSNVSENENDRSKISPKAFQSDNNLILKAINKRKLQLACPICSSCVVNMSDHLVKKHSIKDRNERKYLMDLVRRTYLSMGKQNSPAQLPPALMPPTVPSTPPIMLPVQRPAIISPTPPIQDKILAASLNTIIQNQQQQQIQSNLNQQNQLIQLAQSHMMKIDSGTQQTLKTIEQMNGQQISYNGAVLSNESIMSQNNNNNLSSNVSSVATNSNQILAGSSSTSTSMSSTPNLPNTSSNSLNTNNINNNNNNNRKFIKCPICLDENKYFVNISDHLIKIHHLVTSEMRKPILKQIKENSTLCINKSQFDLVYFSNLNKKIKLDQMTSQMPSISLQQADLEAQEHQDQKEQLAQLKAEPYKQIQIQQIQQRTRDILTDAIDRDSNDTLIENLTNIYYTSSAATKSNSDQNESEKQTVPNRAVFKSKQKQILDNYEQECNDSNQSPGQKASSAANVYENANDNLDNKDDNNENIKINGNTTTNFLVTDEDIADYSDLINLNYEPLFSIKSSNSRPGINYESIRDWDFETNDLYVPSNLSSEDIVINGLFRYDDDNANSESVEFEGSTKRKQESNSNKLISFKKIRSEQSSSRKSAENDQHSTQEDCSIKSEAFSFKFTSPQNPIAQKSIRTTSEPPVLVRSARNVTNSPTSSESPFNSSSPSHFDTNSYRDLLNSQEKEESPDSESSEKVRTDVWNKLNTVEENLNKTIKSFNQFTQNLMNQIQFFNDQFQSSISQINSLKNSLAELNGKSEGSSKSNPSS